MIFCFLCELGFLANTDFEMEDQEIKAKSSTQFKAIVKKYVRSATFQSLLKSNQDTQKKIA